MVDWTKGMQQTFEYYTVDPNTWGDNKKLDEIESCKITWDSSEETLGHATIESSQILDETYVRVYLKAIQNGVTYKEPLATMLAITPSIKHNGKRRKISTDAYTPLIELKEKGPSVGYSVLKGNNDVDLAYRLTRENLRAPVVKPSGSHTLFSDFVADMDDTWLSFNKDLLAVSNREYSIDPMGRILIARKPDLSSLQPVWTFTDDNSSILYSDVEDERDLYGVPNVVEAVYSTDSGYLFSRVVNKDRNSVISTVSRGREIVHRDTNPNFQGVPSQEQLNVYAKQLLKNLSSLEHKITFKHGYCKVRVGDCVLINYRQAGLNNIRAVVQSQNISCTPGCPVEATAVYTTQLWG